MTCPPELLAIFAPPSFGFYPFSGKQLRFPSSWAIKETVASDQKCNILKYEHHSGFRWISVLGCCSNAVVGVVQYLQPDGGDEENVAELNKTCDNRQATTSWLEASCC